MNIFDVFYASKNEQKALEMSAYMKNKFPFIGIQKPVRAALSKDFFKEAKKRNVLDWQFVDQCYKLPEREFHYLAIDYIQSLSNLLVMDDIMRLEKLITTNSWWDSVDSLDEIVGNLCLKYPELKESVVSKWIESSNLWLKRVAINFQLKYKEKTDVDFLSRAILYNSDSKEFFVNKAIGWALREYSKTNREWVSQFLKNNSLTPLSVREASKYL